MLKSVYDTDDNGIVDEAEDIAGTPNPDEYYGTDATGTKGFYPLPTTGTGDMTKAVYDTDDNGIVDSSEEVAGATNALDYYGTDDTNTKGFYSLPTAVSDILANNPIEIGDALIISSNLYPPIITVDEDDYNPTGLDTAAVVYLQASANISLTGLEAGQDGRVIFMSNVGTKQIKLESNNANSLAPNRFLLNVDLILKPSNGVTLLYSDFLQRWTVLNIS